jgi:hypothetical protein
MAVLERRFNHDSRWPASRDGRSVTASLDQAADGRKSAAEPAPQLPLERMRGKFFASNSVIQKNVDGGIE